MEQKQEEVKVDNDNVKNDDMTKEEIPDHTMKSNLYYEAVKMMNSSRISQEVFTRIVNIFEALGDYEDAPQLLQICIDRAEKKYKKVQFLGTFIPKI